MDCIIIMMISIFSGILVYSWYSLSNPYLLLNDLSLYSQSNPYLILNELSLYLLSNPYLLLNDLSLYSLYWQNPDAHFA